MSIDALFETAVKYKSNEHRTAPGERGMDLYADELFIDANASTANPLKCWFIDYEGVVQSLLKNPAFGKGFQQTFDTEGAMILDLGAGAGNLSRDQGELGWRSKIIGVDLFGEGGRGEVTSTMKGDIKKNIPPSPRAVLGDWLQLSFPDNTFDYILAYESFPRYLFPNGYPHKSHENISSIQFQHQSFSEINRVAKKGCIWRGTFPSLAWYPPESKEGQISKKYLNPLFKDFLDHGWGKIIIFGKKRFAALKT